VVGLETVLVKLWHVGAFLGSILVLGDFAANVFHAGITSDASFGFAMIGMIILAVTVSVWIAER